LRRWAEQRKSSILSHAKEDTFITSIKWRKFSDKRGRREEEAIGSQSRRRQ
jgi:hypothetical protein